MRWVGLVVLLWSVAAAAETHKAASQRRPHGPATRVDAAKAPDAPRPDVAKKVAMAKKAVTLNKHEIAVEPNAFTNDPVLGKGERIAGEGVTGLVAFTFDDGPNPETTPAVLDALKQYDVPATFFIVTRRLVGKDGEKPREILARTMAEGHLVESHSVHHMHLGRADAKKLDNEIDKSFVMLSTEAKRPIGMFRAPFGSLNGAGRTRLKKLGVTEVFWSIDTRDWHATNAEHLRKHVMTQIVKEHGGVVLMHDAKPITAQIIAEVLDDLEAENCRRLTAMEEPLWPVSIHYFVRDGQRSRTVPDDVAKRTEAYKAALPARCANRPHPVPTAPPVPASATQPPAAPAK